MCYKGGAPLSGPKFPLKGEPPYTVEAVLRSSGRAVTDSSFDLFDRAVTFLTATARGNQALSDILLIAASQMHGDSDPLSAEKPPPPWQADQKFVTALFPEENLESRVGYKAEGYTEYYPAAVYVSDYSTTVYERDADLACTLMHEYTHVALARIYWNVSSPWTDEDESFRSALDRRARRLALREAFDAITREPAGLYGVPNDDLRTALKTLSQNWAGYDGVRRYPESVPYLIEALFTAARFQEQDSVVVTVFGKNVMEVFTRYVLPDVGEAAQKVRAAALIT
jgi:hypothetical protein